jgi:hypothetical protein
MHKRCGCLVCGSSVGSRERIYKTMEDSGARRGLETLESVSHLEFDCRYLDLVVFDCW